MRKRLLWIFGGLVLCVAVFGESALANLLHAARFLEVKPLPAQPEWAKRQDAPLLTVAWISDLHILDEDSRAQVAIACRAIREKIKPDITFVTGDLCGLPQNQLPKGPTMTIGERRMTWMKEFLDTELPGGYAILPGDNWHEGFEFVFGADKRSFSMAGFQFVFLSLDEAALERDGCGIFAEDTWQWLEKQLQENVSKPVFLVTHEPVLPPLFLDAPKLQEILKKNPQVLGVLSGHLHLDLEFTQGHWKQWCGPAIGRSHNPIVKCVQFYSDQVLMTSYERTEKEGSFDLASKWQRIEIPENLRANLPSKRPAEELKMENIQEMAPRARRQNSQLLKRFGELTKNNMAFMMNAVFPKAKEK